MRTAWLLVLLGCGSEPNAPPPIRFLHTFAAGETELFNATMAERGLAVESSLVPFARGQQVIGEILHAGVHCPELIRIDATWLPGLVADKLVREVPAELAALDWTPEAADLAHLGGTAWGVPQTVDGLVVVRDGATAAPANASVDALVAAAAAAKSPATPYPLGLRVDGYWLVPWLRAAGAEIAIHGSDGEGATKALGAYAALFGDVAPPPPPAGAEAPEELRRWGAREVAYWVTGPWQLGALADRDRIAIGALAHAPRGGQLLVVPACAQHPDDGWRLARELTEVTVELRFAEAFASVPTRRAALAAAPALSRAVAEALRGNELLPRALATPLLFDDLNPALAAVVARDASAEEAIEGVRRSWRRLRSP